MKRLQHRVALERLHDPALDARSLAAFFHCRAAFGCEHDDVDGLVREFAANFLDHREARYIRASTSLINELDALPCIVRVDAETVLVQKENQPLRRAQY